MSRIDTLWTMLIDTKQYSLLDVLEMGRPGLESGLHVRQGVQSCSLDKIQDDDGRDLIGKRMIQLGEFGSNSTTDTVTDKDERPGADERLELSHEISEISDEMIEREAATG
jgi:hypothetical protein